MNINYKLIILWLLTVVGMILHFNYHVGEMFYGINVVRPDANGTVPSDVVIIRNVFYHLPVIWIVCLLYFQKTGFRLALFLISIVYSVAHLAHLGGEVVKAEKDLSQLSLLSLVFVVSILIVVEQYKHWKQKQNA